MRKVQVQVLLVALIAIATTVAAGAGDGEFALPSCESLFVDLTPEMTEWVETLPPTVHLLAVGRPEVRYSSGTKVSRQFLEFEGDDGILQDVEISCTGTCSGNGCGVTGCDIVEAGCSACSCTGADCTAQCSCKKKMAIRPQPH